MKRIWLVGFCLNTWAAAVAAEQVVIDLTGVQIKDGRNVARDSSPEKIAAAFGYRYDIAGLVQGNGGLLEALIPDPTPLDEVLESFQEGSSAYLKGEGYNVSGALPIEVLEQRFEGEQDYGGFTLRFGVTFSGGIDADGLAYFRAEDVLMKPAWLIGSLKFTEGSVTIVRIPAVTGDMNWDGVVDFNDIDPFVLALSDPDGYLAQFGYAPIYSGDVNRDESFDFNDIDPFVALLTG